MRFGRDLRAKPELNAVRQAYWDTLQIGPGGGLPQAWEPWTEHFISQRGTKLCHPWGQQDLCSRQIHSRQASEKGIAPRSPRQNLA